MKTAYPRPAPRVEWNRTGGVLLVETVRSTGRPASGDNDRQLPVRTTWGVL